MTKWWTLGLALMAGLLFSAFYFGGLWWTVRKGVFSKHPALWFCCSMLLRTSLVLIGFYVVGRGHWERLVVCFLAFVVGRFVVMRLTRSADALQTRPNQEACRAP